MKEDFIEKTDSGAIINKDNSGLALYKKRKKKMTEDSRRISNLESSVQDLHNKIDLLLSKL